MALILPELLESGVTVPAAYTYPGRALNLMSTCFLVFASTEKTLAFYDSSPLPESFMLIGNLPSGVNLDGYPEAGVLGP